MLRLLTLALLLANLLYFGWTLGWFDAVVGIRALGDREPQRLQRQVQPELVQLSAVDAKVLPAAESSSAPAAAASDPASDPASAPGLAAVPASAAASAPAQAKAQVPAASAALASAPPKAASAALAAASAASAPSLSVARSAIVASAAAPAASVNLACLEAGPFEASQLAAAETAIRSVTPAASWNQRRAGNGEWMIYMGPYPDDAWIERKKAELSRIRGGLSYDLVGPTAQYGRGISLGRFTSKAEADKRLEELRPRGIRTARVIQSGEGPDKIFLRIAKADPALTEQLAGIQWPTGQAGFAPCPAAR